MKEYPNKWTNDSFEEMSWHDNRVRGIAFHNPHDLYVFDVSFDLDYILEWICNGSFYQFVVAPAMLTFHSANNVRFDMTMNYKQDLDINRVERVELTTASERDAGYRRWRFEIYFHGQVSPVSLEATGYTQILRAAPRLQDGQALNDDNYEVDMPAGGDSAQRLRRNVQR